jgi:hypothetical protein
MSRSYRPQGGPPAIDDEAVLIEEIESRLDPSGELYEALPSQPLRFVFYYLKYYKWALSAMVLLELGQAACQILIPKAVQRLIDSAASLSGTGGSVWTALADPMKLFVLLNLGILVFSRSSGSLLVMVGPALRKLIGICRVTHTATLWGTLPARLPIGSLKCPWG